MRKLKLRKAKYLFTHKQKKQNPSPDLSASKVCALNHATLLFQAGVKGDVYTKKGSDERVEGHRDNQDEVSGTNNNLIRDEFRARSDDGGRQGRCVGGSLLGGEWDVPHKRGVLGTQAEEAVLRPLDVQVGVEAAGEETDRVCDSEACESSSWTLTRGG